MSLERFATRLPPNDVASITKRGAYSEEAGAVQSIMTDNGWAEKRRALGFDQTQIRAHILDRCNGQKEGFGRFTYEDGKYFEGYWHKGKQLGVGAIYSIIGDAIKYG